MDRGGRFSRPLTLRLRPAGAVEFAPPSRFVLLLRRAFVRFSSRPLLRHIEFAFIVLLLAGTGIFGAVRGGHTDALLVSLQEYGDAAAGSAGFGVASVEISGLHRLTREEVLSLAGVTENSSLLLLTAESMRARLKRNPWIAEAMVRKLYPDRVEIVIEERQAFALWQRGGKLHVIARDGAVLESETNAKSGELPLVVGIGAEKRAGSFVDLLDRYPEIRAELRAGVLVAERRWNLRLKNGTDVRLPENDPDSALARLSALAREKKILTRDVVMIDLRASGRVAIRLSDEVAEARAAAAKQHATKRKGTDA